MRRSELGIVRHQRTRQSSGNGGILANNIRSLLKRVRNNHPTCKQQRSTVIWDCSPTQHSWNFTRESKPSFSDISDQRKDSIESWRLESSAPEEIIENRNTRWRQFQKRFIESKIQRLTQAAVIKLTADDSGYIGGLQLSERTCICVAPGCWLMWQLFSQVRRSNCSKSHSSVSAPDGQSGLLIENADTCRGLVRLWLDSGEPYSTVVRGYGRRTWLVGSCI